jgi:putative hydrolase of the HAD superfamily
VDVVFDFGNVLVEWNPLRLVNDHFSEHMRPEDSAETFTERWVNPHWLRYDLGEIDTQTVAHAMAPTLGCEVPPLHAFIEKIPHVLPTLDASVAAIQKLFAARDGGAAIRVFYLSNMPSEFADVLERRFDWIARFDGGIFSGREKLSKPDPDIYAALESRYSLDPLRTLFFDDSHANIVAAQARGWQAVQVFGSADVVNTIRERKLAHSQTSPLM